MSETTFDAWLERFNAAKQEQASRFAGHEFDEDGWHDQDECDVCALAAPALSDCRCGECCRSLIIEVTVKDAEREPKIKELGSPLYVPPELLRNGQQELAGYLLNSQESHHACIFLDQATNLCGIYDTRPITCRRFDCTGAGREQLIELGILPPREAAHEP